MRKIWPFTKDAYGILGHMKGGKKPNGFTISETLIVVAITGVMFSAIVFTLSGRQNRTEFTQSIQEVQSQIEQVIHDVGVGYYPNANNFQCSASLSGPVFGVGSTEQGANKGCVFLGKAIQFGVPSTKNGIEDFKIYSIAGLQRTAAGDEVTDYASAKPKVVAPPSTPAGVDTTETKYLLYGLTTKEITYGSPASQVGAIAFVNSLASYEGSAIQSGAQQVRIVPIMTSALGQTQNQAITAINGQFTSSIVDPADGIRLCFVSGGTDQSGLITIGGTSRQLAVTLTIKGNKTCS
jgi:type II secretory pathway pseudopilin PulG